MGPFETSDIFLNSEGEEEGRKRYLEAVVDRERRRRG